MNGAKLIQLIAKNMACRGERLFAPTVFLVYKSKMLYYQFRSVYCPLPIAFIMNNSL